MCRSIKTLRQVDGLPGDDEIQAAALQYVRKVSGYRKPSRANQAVFERAVAQVAAATQLLLDDLQSGRTPKNRAEPEQSSAEG